MIRRLAGGGESPTGWPRTGSGVPLPLFWPLVKSAGALELLAHRVLWSLVICAILLLTRGAAGLVGEDRPTRRNLIMLGCRRIRLGELGHLHLGGQPRPCGGDRARLLHQPDLLDPGRRDLLPGVVAPAAVDLRGLAVAAVVVLTVDYGRLPWIALVARGHASDSTA